MPLENISLRWSQPDAAHPFFISTINCTMDKYLQVMWYELFALKGTVSRNE
jgi:hypothetical protein